MSAYWYILLDKDPQGHIATLNRPDRRNALNDVMRDEIGDAIEAVDADDSLRVLVLTGAGRAFCAGGDLEQLRGGAAKPEAGYRTTPMKSAVASSARSALCWGFSGWKNRSSL